MLIPLRTDTPLKHPPLMNYTLIVLNMGVFVLTLSRSAWIEPWIELCSLNAALPEWPQFLTYQFIHGDIWHLVGNMWFLWVFGNSLNNKLGHWAYLLFYLAGGAFAGWGFALLNHNVLIGASGSIAAVTTGFMVLFPRSRILFLFFFILITWFELPTLWVVLFKMVLYDNLLMPRIQGSLDNVAYSAHLFGYLFGFASTMALLLFGWVTRDQFDLLAVIKRWNQRREFSVAMRDPDARARAQHGNVARPVVVDPQKRRELQARLDQASGLRARIAEALAATPPRREAIDYFEQLMLLDPQQFLSLQQQMAMARLLYEHHKFPQAAAAFEAYLQRYPRGPEQDQVRLLLGIIYARDLGQPEVARGHLTAALELLDDPARREQCNRWLEHIGSASPSTPGQEGGATP